jgi:hypothetical protein
MEEHYLGSESPEAKRRAQGRRLDMSPEDHFKMKAGEANQGDYLVSRKSASPHRYSGKMAMPVYNNLGLGK